MRILLDFLYAVVAMLTVPIWLVRMARTGKIRTDWRARFGSGPSLPDTRRPGERRVLIHAVSVGEINAVQSLIEALTAAEPSLQIIITATTDTGYARAVECFGQQHTVARYPFDFSFAVRRLLDRIRPELVVLTELEVWPNFTAICRHRGISVGVVNGRLTERSARRYGRIRALIAPVFRRLDFVCAQNDAYASRFTEIGVPADRVTVTGNIKWDATPMMDDVPGASELAEAMGIDRDQPLVVAGSTAPGEHALMVTSVPEGVQLLCAPRKPEWADEAAQAMPGCVRRSQRTRGSETGRFLLDTTGEMLKAYALADVVVVGRSFGTLYGSNVIEPVALGKPTIVGPAVQDFRDAVELLVAGGGLLQVTADALPAVLASLLQDSRRRIEIAERGRSVLKAQAGATGRTAAIVLGCLRGPAERGGGSKTNPAVPE